MKATLAQLGERQTEVKLSQQSEGLVFDPQKSHHFLLLFFPAFLTKLNACYVTQKYQCDLAKSNLAIRRFPSRGLCQPD